jgi:hypothetical protein
VQFILAASMTRVVPFGERFATAQLDERQFYYGLAGMTIFASDRLELEPTLLWSMTESGNRQFGLRVKSTHTDFGWLMAQYVRSAFFTTQLGIPLDIVGKGALELSLTYGWYFGTISKQLGNSFTLGVTYFFESVK